MVLSVLIGAALGVAGAAVQGVFRERAVAVVLHDLNLAAAYADRVLVMSGGRLVADGPPDRVLASETFSEVYGCDIDVHRNGTALPVAPRRAV
ncbi:hypothetical protein ACFQVD_24765 [Streptosporangium amethystogenes subsp. fukuiense]|uniref:Uncharacterized protein n=1 Tax=Streptosporangium amethystogenes subsp. fukuiense TaxID=698418 RepID=A0ABW2T4G8_9ACTN